MVSRGDLVQVYIRCSTCRWEKEIDVGTPARLKFDSLQRKAQAFLDAGGIISASDEKAIRRQRKRLSQDERNKL